MLTDTYNGYVDAFNSLNTIELHPDLTDIQLPKFDLKHATFNPVILDSYDFLMSQELITFLNDLKDNTVREYYKITSIPNLIPKFKSMEEIDDELERELIRLGLV